jgi:hypothetical protein
LVGNLGRDPHVRPASVLRGALIFDAPEVWVEDADGQLLEPFASTITATDYELRLPSAAYQLLVVHARKGNMRVRAVVPALEPESVVEDVDLDAAAVTETMIMEARLSADDGRLRLLSPEVVADTQELIRGALGTAGPAANLLAMVERLLAAGNPDSGGEPVIFLVPELDDTFATVSSALDGGWITRNRPDYDGDGSGNPDSDAFDQLLAELAQTYDPSGCADPRRLRVVFVVDFNDGRKDGNCLTINRFKWAVDAPGKQMFFVGWVHDESPVQDPLVDALLGGGSPNQVQMYDDGSNGDENAGDNLWTVFFDLPRDLRLGYKYTWGRQGDVWTGTEEWPGNSHILEVVDVNGDDIVYRVDNFGDEATNKDNANLYIGGTGSITWETDANGDGVEDARERMVDLDNDCVLDEWVTPGGVGSLRVPCSTVGN